MLALHFEDIVLIPMGEREGLKGRCVCELGVGLSSGGSRDEGGSAHHTDSRLVPVEPHT